MMKNKNGNRKVLIVLMLLLLLLPLFKVSVSASEVPIRKADGSGDVTYIGSDVKVTIPDTYNLPESSFRAVWVSAFTGDISGFSSEAQYKQEIMQVFKTLEYYNINAMIFHVRARNDAFYESKYNKWSPYYNSNPTWDALPWIIEECHKRGIEFHAWLNPYRVETSSANVNEVAKKFRSNNPASNPKNLLNSSDSVILNPGLPEVRRFLINTCMELIEDYDVDAIHFDDYFYAAGVDDSETYAKYNTEGMSLGDWRREQVNLFIKGLSDEMRAYNKKTGRRVQLGIAPSGIWRSGDGKVTYDANGNAITNGSSTTSTFIHYGGHLFADTLKWVNNEWIDYILPQSYAAIEHPDAGYPDLIKWWAQVVKYKKVNLYAALGLYMRNEKGGSSWTNNDLEGYNQIMYGSKYDTVHGYSVYDFKSLRASASGSDRGFKKVNELWSKPAILPEIKTMDKIVIDTPKNLTVGKVNNGYRLQFDEVENAKFYVIYRSSKELTYSPNEVIDIIGNQSYEKIVNYVDLIDTKDNYYYGIKAQSYSLTLTDGVSIETTNSIKVDEAPIEKVDTIITSSNLIVNSKLDVKWRKIYHSVGDEINYELYYSTDANTWKKGENEIELNDGNGYVSSSLKIPSNAKTLYIRVRAYNNSGESMSEIKTIRVYENLGSINHFCIKGEIYSESTIEFVWNNKMEYPDIKYTIQKSYDGIVYEDVIEVETTKEVNIRKTYKLPKETGRIYYRVKGEVGERVGYSNEKMIEVKGSLGEISDYEVNSEVVKEYYVLKEEEIIEITYSIKTGVTYISRLSRDGNTWVLASKHHSKNKLETEGSKQKQTIYASGMDLKLYYYLEANKDGSTTKTKLVEIYVIPEFIFYDELMTFMNNEQKSLLGKLGMFSK